MLSRVAFSLYWTARYLERAENVARFLAVNEDLSLESKAEEASQWSPLIQTTGDQELFLEKYKTYSKENVTRFLAFDKDYHNSIISSLWTARENARSVRNVISRDMWLSINSLYLSVKAQGKSNEFDETDLIAFLDQVKSGCITVQGITDATMSRDQAWLWWRIGSMIERADKTSRILDVKYFMLLPSPQDVGTNFDHLQWIALLDSASASQMFRQTQRAMKPEEIASFLVLDQQFPRAIAHAVTEADKCLHQITSTPHGQFGNEAERALGHLRAKLCYAEMDTIFKGGLHEFLDSFQTSLNTVDKLLYEFYFGGSHTSTAVS